MLGFRNIGATLTRMRLAFVAIVSAIGCQDSKPVIANGSVWEFETRKSTYLLANIDQAESKWLAQSFVQDLVGTFRVDPDPAVTSEVVPTFLWRTLDLQISVSATPAYGCLAANNDLSVDLTEVGLSGSVSPVWDYVSVFGVVADSTWGTATRTCNTNTPTGYVDLRPIDSLRGGILTQGNDPTDTENGTSLPIYEPFTFLIDNDGSYSLEWAMRRIENTTTYDPETIATRSITAISGTLKCMRGCQGSDFDEPGSMIAASDLACSRENVDRKCNAAKEELMSLCSGEDPQLWRMIYERSDAPTEMFCDAGSGAVCGDSDNYKSGAFVDIVFSTHPKCDSQVKALSCRIACYGWRPVM